MLIREVKRLNSVPVTEFLAFLLTLSCLPAAAQEAVILTPRPGPEPRINGARIFGVRPESPFLFTIPVTGERPMRFAADGLPSGLKVDPETGQITGRIEKEGEYLVTLQASNRHGAAKRPFKIICGETRDARGRINANRRFPDMKALTDYIHSKGLKADILQRQPRDIVLNLCQYGMGNVWEWGREVGGNSWRTAGDLGLTFEGIAKALFRDGFDVYANGGLDRYGGPGGWNDPDYLLLGYLSNWKGQTAPTPLTPNEQYTHVSLWYLLAAPLIFSGDITRLDDFTLSLLTNDEVIEVDQDPQGRPWHQRPTHGARPLAAEGSRHIRGQVCGARASPRRLSRPNSVTGTELRKYIQGKMATAPVFTKFSSCSGSFYRENGSCPHF